MTTELYKGPNLSTMATMLFDDPIFFLEPVCRQYEQNYITRTFHCTLGTVGL
jgi:hypothetical protein